MSSMKPLKLSSIEESCAQSRKSAPSLVLFENLLNTPIQAVEVGWSLVGVSSTVFSTNPASPSEVSEAARLVKPVFESAPPEKRRERAGIVLLNVIYKSDQCNLVPSSSWEHPEIFAYLLLH